MHHHPFVATVLLFCCLIAFGREILADESAVVSQLRRGGMVVFLQPPASAATADPQPPPPPKCRTGDGLSPTNWIVARNLGTGFRKQQIRFDSAHSSFLCAARHTAYLLVGADKVHHHHGLASSCATGSSAADRAMDELHRVMRLPFLYPAMNRLVVGEGCALQTIADAAWPACAVSPRPGDAVVLRLASGPRIEFVSCLTRDQLLAWSDIREF